MSKKSKESRGLSESPGEHFITISDSSEFSRHTAIELNTTGESRGTSQSERMAMTNYPLGKGCKDPLPNYKTPSSMDRVANWMDTIPNKGGVLIRMDFDKTTGESQETDCKSKPNSERSFKSIKSEPVSITTDHPSSSKNGPSPKSSPLQPLNEIKIKSEPTRISYISPNFDNLNSNHDSYPENNEDKSPETQKKELYSYLQLMNPADRKEVACEKNRRSIRVKNLNMLLERKEQHKKVDVFEDATNSVTDTVAMKSFKDLNIRMTPSPIQLSDFEDDILEKNSYFNFLMPPKNVLNRIRNFDDIICRVIKDEGIYKKAIRKNGKAAAKINMVPVTDDKFSIYGPLDKTKKQGIKRQQKKKLLLMSTPNIFSPKMKLRKLNGCVFSKLEQKRIKRKSTERKSTSMENNNKEVEKSHTIDKFKNTPPGELSPLHGFEPQENGYVNKLTPIINSINETLPTCEKFDLKPSSSETVIDIYSGNFTLKTLLQEPWEKKDKDKQPSAIQNLFKSISHTAGMDSVESFDPGDAMQIDQINYRVEEEGFEPVVPELVTLTGEIKEEIKDEPVDDTVVVGKEISELAKKQDASPCLCTPIESISSKEDKSEILQNLENQILTPNSLHTPKSKPTSRRISLDVRQTPPNSKNNSPQESSTDSTSTSISKPTSPRGRPPKSTPPTSKNTSPRGSLDSKVTTPKYTPSNSKLSSSADSREDTRSLHSSLKQSRKRQPFSTSTTPSTTHDWEFEGKKSNQDRKDSHAIYFDKKNGKITNIFFVDFNLFVVQELTVSLWNQTALGNVLGAQNMWVSYGSITKLYLSKESIHQKSQEMVISIDTCAAYVELWTKEHKSDIRQGPMTDVFVTVYYWRIRQNCLEKKMLHLDSINAFSDDVQYVVLKSSLLIVVSWHTVIENNKQTHVHLYEFAQDFQRITNSLSLKYVEHYVSSLHNIEDCQSLVMGCGENKISIWNIDHGYLIATIELVNIKLSLSTLWVKCDRGILFLVQQCVDRELRLIALNGRSRAWKKLKTFTPNEIFDRVIGVYVENGILISFYEQGILCWNAQTGAPVMEEVNCDTQYFLSGKHMISLLDNQIIVKHALTHLITSDSTEES